MNYDLVTQKKQELEGCRPLPAALVKNLEDWYRVELTYTSNAIEGNTLTRRETALVIEKGLTVGGKSLVEHLEAVNHASALDWAYSVADRALTALTEDHILRIHRLILRGIDDENTGHYRSVPVRITGSAVIIPNALKVPQLMHGFIKWLHHAELHPVELAAMAHYQLVTIHPFVDGNGRTARLLMNLILRMQGYPPAIIRKRDRLAYISALEKAQLGGSKEDYLKLVARAVGRSLDIYLRAAKGEDAPELEDAAKFMKIGTLARAVQETVPTIRHWTKEGLLHVADTTASGYQLYAPEMMERVETIKKFKEQRFTLREIKEKLQADNAPAVSAHSKSAVS